MNHVFWMVPYHNPQRIAKERLPGCLPSSDWDVDQLLHFFWRYASCRSVRLPTTHRMAAEHHATAFHNLSFTNPWNHRCSMENCKAHHTPNGGFHSHGGTPIAGWYIIYIYIYVYNGKFHKKGWWLGVNHPMDICRIFRKSGALSVSSGIGPRRSKKRR